MFTRRDDLAMRILLGACGLAALGLPVMALIGCGGPPVPPTTQMDLEVIGIVYSEESTYTGVKATVLSVDSNDAIGFGRGESYLFFFYGETGIRSRLLENGDLISARCAEDYHCYGLELEQ